MKIKRVYKNCVICEKERLDIVRLIEDQMLAYNYITKKDIKAAIDALVKVGEIAIPATITIIIETRKEP